MYKTQTIVVVDDEEDVRVDVERCLQNAMFTVLTVKNGLELLDLLNQQEVDLIILDIHMPIMDGFAACQKIRCFSDIPIIFLTNHNKESHRIQGFKLGADDYITKPFNHEELVARIIALLRRSMQITHKKSVMIGDICIDEYSRAVKVGHKKLELTKKEYDLLLLFAKNEERAFTREQLYELIWENEIYDQTLRTVDTHIKTLRMKLGCASSCIVTIWGVGYKLSHHYQFMNTCN